MADEPVSRILRAGPKASCEQSTYGKQRTYAVSDVNCVSRARIAGTRRAHLRRGLSLLVAAVIFAASASAQDRISRVPFHIINGLILLDATVNGHPATFVLDTGSATTIVSPKAYGAIRLDGDSLELAEDGAGRLGYAKHLQADVTLTTGARFSLTVSVMNLDNASKQIGAKIDGILGEDILRTFSYVRIDYRARVIELEQ